MSLELKLLTFNIHKGFSHFNTRFVLHELREAIRGVSADIVFLQEVIGEHSLHKIRHSSWPEKSQYEFLADEVWTDHAYGKNAVYSEGHHGNAVLSKFPISRWENFDISAHRFEQRGALFCEVPVNDGGTLKNVVCVCVHLGLLDGWRKRQFARLVELIQQKSQPDQPLIVAGDFNDWSQQAKKHLAEPLGLSEAFESLQGSCAKTYPCAWPLMQLDRVYLRGLRPVSCTVHRLSPWSRLSDHAALLVGIGT